jgi:hypothetical protein
MQNLTNGQQSQKSANKTSKVTVFFAVYTAIFLAAMLYHITFGPETLEGDKQVAIDGFFLLPSMIWGFTQCNKPANQYE